MSDLVDRQPEADQSEEIRFLKKQMTQLNIERRNAIEENKLLRDTIVKMSIKMVEGDKEHNDTD